MSNEPDKTDVEAFREWKSLTERYHDINRDLTASFSEGVGFRAACEEKAREIRETPEYRAFYGEEALASKTKTGSPP